MDLKVDNDIKERIENCFLPILDEGWEISMRENDDVVNNSETSHGMEIYLIPPTKIFTYRKYDSDVIKDDNFLKYYPIIIYCLKDLKKQIGTFYNFGLFEFFIPFDSIKEHGGCGGSGDIPFVLDFKGSTKKGNPSQVTDLRYLARPNKKQIKKVKDFTNDSNSKSKKYNKRSK